MLGIKVHPCTAQKCTLSKSLEKFKAFTLSITFLCPQIYSFRRKGSESTLSTYNWRAENRHARVLHHQNYPLHKYVTFKLIKKKSVMKEIIFLNQSFKIICSVRRDITTLTNYTTDPPFFCLKSWNLDAKIRTYLCTTMSFFYAVQNKKIKVVFCIQKSGQPMSYVSSLDNFVLEVQNFWGCSYSRLSQTTFEIGAVCIITEI